MKPHAAGRPWVGRSPSLADTPERAADVNASLMLHGLVSRVWTVLCAVTGFGGRPPGCDAPARFSLALGTATAYIVLTNMTPRAPTDALAPELHRAAWHGLRLGLPCRQIETAHAAMEAVGLQQTAKRGWLGFPMPKTGVVAQDSEPVAMLVHVAHGEGSSLGANQRTLGVHLAGHGGMPTEPGFTRKPLDSSMIQPTRVSQPGKGQASCRSMQE